MLGRDPPGGVVRSRANRGKLGGGGGTAGARAHDADAPPTCGGMYEIHFCIPVLFVCSPGHTRMCARRRRRLGALSNSADGRSLSGLHVCARVCVCGKAAAAAAAAHTKERTRNENREIHVCANSSRVLI